MIFKALAELEQSNLPGAFCVVVKAQGSTPRNASAKMVVYADGHIVGTVGGGELERRVIVEAIEAIQDGKPRLLEYTLSEPQRGDPGVCGGQVEVFVDPILTKPNLVVIGAGHVGKAVAWLAHWLGFRVVINDDRSEFCTPDAIPNADEYVVCQISELPEKVEITPNTYIVLTTRGVDIDAPGLPALLATSAAFIGVIGSKRRWATTRQKLLDKGLPDEVIQRVRSPIGLDIHAETPEEIALSIMSEIIKIRNS